MAYTGAWKARSSQQAGAQKWGTGWNPVHAQHGGTGRNTAPYGTDVLVPEQIVEQESLEALHDYAGYTTEDTAASLWGYNMDTGTADRTPWDDDLAPGDLRMATPQGMPQWGYHTAGRPGGNRFRSIEHGDTVTYTAKQFPYETVGEGWENKTHGSVNDSLVSDPSQYVVNTSMTQRDQVRTGSQTQRASEYHAPIRSRIVGMRLKPWSGGQRHYDMQPREQNQHIRAWWARSAGTGHRSWMAANEMYVSDPLQRTPPPNPYAGPVIDDTGTTNTGGYVGEDVIPYV